MTDSLGFLPPLLKVDQDTLKDVPRTVTSARHKAPIYLSEKLEDDVSVERVAMEELVESMLDSVDQLAGKTTTIVQHAATHKHAIHSAACTIALRYCNTPKSSGMQSVTWARLGASHPQAW